MSLGPIFAMGGGGFLMEPDNLRLDRHVVALTGNPRPRVCFLPHATDDPNRTTVAFFKAFSALETRPSVLSLFAPHTADLEGFLLEQDAIYVGGGNTKSMLALWREWELDRILRLASAQGVVLAGVSAGANCWFEQCTTDSIPGKISGLNCLGFLSGSFTPHFDGEAERRPTVHRLLAERAILPGYAADDGAGLLFRDGQLEAVFTSRPQARAFRLEIDENGQVSEVALPANFLSEGT